MKQKGNSLSNIFVNTIVFVSDIEKSKLFYADLLKIRVKQDLTDIVFFENQLVLHSAGSIMKTIFKKDRSDAILNQGKKNILLYFECEDIQNLYNNLKDKVRIIHKIEKQKWGQKVFRFYDPDDHIVEFGEPFGDNETS